MDFSVIQDYLGESKEYKEIISCIDRGVCGSGVSGNSFELYLENIYGSARSLLASRIFMDMSKRGKSMFLVSGTTSEAERMYMDMKSFLPGARVFYFPPWEILPYESISPFYDIVHNRIEVLHNILLGEPLLLVSPVINLMKVIIPKDIFRGEYLVFRLGDLVDYDGIISRFMELGYFREARVEEPGSFSVKGGIIDIFPSSSEYPVRLELLGARVHSIRVFDVVSQVSRGELEEAEILPQREFIFTDEGVERAISLIGERFGDSRFRGRFDIVSKIRDRVYFQGIEHLLPFFYEGSSTLVDYFSLDELIFVFSELAEVRKRGCALFAECETLFGQSHKANVIKADPGELYLEYDSVIDRFKNKVYMSRFPFLVSGGDLGGEVVLGMPLSSMDSFVSSVSLFRQRVVESLAEGYVVFILASYLGQAKRLKEILSDLEPILVSEAEGISGCDGVLGGGIYFHFRYR